MTRDGRLQRLLHSALQYARVRIEILELELDLERARIGAMLLRSLVLALTALVCTQLIAVLVLSLAWQTPWRHHVIAALIAATVVGGVALWRSLKRLRRDKPQRPISAVIADLDRLSETPFQEPTP